MSKNTYEPLVTDFVGQQAESAMTFPGSEHTKFILDNGYGLSVIRLTPEIIEDTIAAGDTEVEYVEGRFDVQAAWKIQDEGLRSFYEAIGIAPYTTDGLELDFLPMNEGTRNTNLTSAEVNDLLHKLNGLEAVA